MRYIFQHKHKLLLLMLLVFSNGMVYLDSTILPVALPKIQSVFHSSSTQMQWMINSYLLALAVFLVPAGKLADVHGRRKFFCIGLGIFGLSSLLCGLSYNSLSLIGFRFIQGIGAAMMAPTSMSLLCEVFPKHERHTVIGILGSLNSIFMTLGPLIGGYCTQYLSWHYIFFINVPISIILIFFTLATVKKSNKLKEYIDVSGFLSFGFGLFFLILALMQAKSWGWGSFSVILLFVLMLLSFFLLYISDKKAKEPFIDFQLFKNSSFYRPIIVRVTVSIARVITVYWVIYYQNVLGYSPFLAGLIVSLSIAPMIFLAPLIGTIVRIFGLKKPVIFGQFLSVIAYIWLAIFMMEGNIYFILPGLILFGIGTVLITSVTYSTAINSVPIAKSSHATSIIITFKNAASCLGIALLGTIINHVQFAKFSSDLYEISPKLDPNLLEGALSGSSKALAVLKALPDNSQEIVKKALAHSYSLGISVTNAFAAVLIVVGFLIIVTMKKIRKRKNDVT